VLIVLTGKTASGKDTIKQSLLLKYPNLKSVITTTSRVPRTGEKEEADYHFLTKVQFQKKIDLRDFAEYVEYGGNLYGTQKKDLEVGLSGDLLWRIDPSRAGEVREFVRRSFPMEMAQKLIDQIIVIYITVSDDVVLQRLAKRGLSGEEIKKRMEDDKKIWEKYKNNYDFIVENIPGKLDQCLGNIVRLIDHAQ